MNTPVQVGSVSLSPLRGKCTLNGLKLLNPSGYKDRVALSVNSLTVDWSWGDLFGDPLRVNHVQLSGVRVNLEGSLSNNNLTKITSGVKSKADEVEKRKPREIVVERLELEDIHASARIPRGAEPTEIELSEMKLEKVSSKNPGALTQKVTLILTEKMVRAIAAKLAGGVLEDGAKAIGDAVQGLFGK